MHHELVVQDDGIADGKKTATKGSTDGGEEKKEDTDVKMKQ